MDIIFGNKFPILTMLNFFDSFFKKDNDLEKMKFSLEIGPHTDLETLPPVKDVYVTMLPGGDYKETADKSGDLVKKGFNPVPHFPARSINNDKELKEYVSRCKDQGVKQALVIGGSRDPIGKFDSSYQIFLPVLYHHQLSKLVLHLHPYT